MEENDAVRDERRRRFLLKLAVGAGAVAGIGALPERWTRPMLQVGALPVHAQTSAVYPLFSTPASLSATNNAGDTGDDIYIVFDGARNLRLELAGDLDPTPANALIGVDTDPGFPSEWDAYSSGSNWTMTDAGGVSFVTHNPSATFTMVFDGPGGQFRLTFTVAVTPTSPPTATVSGVSIEPN